jgi:F-type H+/Na+-transporting ATPase subunit alpha
MNTFKSFLELLKSKVDVLPKTIIISSATALDSDFINDVKSVLGKEIVINHVIDSKVTNGVTLQLGDMIIDSSTQKSLNDVKQKIKEVNGGDFWGNIRKEIMGFTATADVSEVGTVLTVKDGVCNISGLSNIMYMEEILLPGGIIALALNLEKDKIGAVILGDYTQIKQGDIAKRGGKLASVPVSKELFGRIINPVGVLQDGGKSINFKENYLIERVAPGVMARKPVDKPLQTGIIAIDSLVPIGKGQRELILGDRQTGKSAVAIDAIINQAGKDVICVYVAIGQKASKIARTVNQLTAKGAMEYTILVTSFASDPAGVQFLAPYSGVAIAEYFADQGKDVLIVYDDLTKHAVAYRELSLLLKRPPGREAYPGDVFYLHSRLLERACNLNEENGGGSITALPIIETQAGDISAYIPTNVISITDGQIFLETDLFYKGQRPAINVGLSVSRVGGSAQTKAMKKVSGSMKLNLAQFRELESFSQFGSDLDDATKNQIERGRRILEVTKQRNNSPLDLHKQVISIYAVNNGYFDTFDLTAIKKAETDLFEYIELEEPNLAKSLNSGFWDEATEQELKRMCSDFISLNKPSN